MLAYQQMELYRVAAEVGEEAKNPDGGLSLDSSNDDIIECIVDIANGEPHKLGITMDELTTYQRDMVVAKFLTAATN
jgi:hypothetical protein